MTAQLARLNQIRALLAEHHANVLALTPGPSLTYVTGHAFPQGDRLTVLFVPRAGRPAAVVPNFEEANWREFVTLDVQLFGWDDATGPAPALEQAAAALGELDTIAVEPLVVRAAEVWRIEQSFPHARIAPGDDLVKSLRLTKGEDELDAIREAAQIAESALEKLLVMVRVGVTERELAAKLSALLFECGGESISFGPIVLSGPNSALPHGVSGGRPVGPGEILLVDFGTTVRGYHCDITRTFVVGAGPDARTREVYEAVRLGNELGKAAAKPGATAHEVHHAAQDHLHKPPFGEFLKHRTGHGLGLDIHEPPSIMDGNHERLAPGTVFTVEPGLYLEGWGGVRIEDDVVITESGYESLTTFPRELRVIGRRP